MEWGVKQSVNTATKDQDLAVVLDSLIKVNRNYRTDLWDLVYPVHHFNFSVLQSFESLVGLFLDFYDLFLVRCFVNVVGVIAQILIIVGLFVKNLSSSSSSLSLRVSSSPSPARYLCFGRQDNSSLHVYTGR